VCLSVALEEDQNLPKLIDRIHKKNPDLVEFRVDTLQRLSILEDISKQKSFPAIITDKTRRGSLTRKIPLEAASFGFEFVDVDLASDLTKGELREIKENGAEVIVSFHNNSTTPPKPVLKKILQLAAKKGGDIFKIVTTATKPEDNLSLLTFLAENSRKTRLVCFAMGELGVPSRVLSPLFGSEFTFAAFSERELTAPGQLSIDNLRSAWSLLGLR
jgi:3-dehydroquinate dehydratase type I